ARRARFGRNLSAPETHRARTTHGKAALSEADRSLPAALRACLRLGARCVAAAAANRTIIRHRDLNGDAVAARCGAEGNLEHVLAVAAARARLARAALATPRAIEDRREDV